MKTRIPDVDTHPADDGPLQGGLGLQQARDHMSEETGFALSDEATIGRKMFTYVLKRAVCRFCGHFIHRDGAPATEAIGNQLIAEQLTVCLKVCTRCCGCPDCQELPCECDTRAA